MEISINLQNWSFWTNKVSDFWQKRSFTEGGVQAKISNGVLGTIFGERNRRLFRVQYFQSIKQAQWKSTDLVVWMSRKFKKSTKSLPCAALKINSLLWSGTKNRVTRMKILILQILMFFAPVPRAYYHHSILWANSSSEDRLPAILNQRPLRARTIT